MSGHGHGHDHVYDHVYDHDLPRLSRDYGNVTGVGFPKQGAHPASGCITKLTTW
jgi:hypothetical protein